MKLHQGLGSLCTRAAAAGSLCWVLANLRGDEWPSTSNSILRAVIESETGRMTLDRRWHASIREALSNHCSPGNTDMPPVYSTLLFFQQLLLQHELQRMPLSLSSWQPTLIAAPDVSFGRGPAVTAAEARGLRGSAPALRAKDLAVKHKDVIEAIRLKLEERGVSLPTSHFADADVELARYAVTVGLLTAHTAAERERVAEAAAARAQATAEWLASHTFMPEEELGSWATVVHWAKDDAEDHPVLVVHLEAALQQDSAGAAAAAEAILGHMEAALRRRFFDDPSRPEQLVVVLDSRGAPTLQFRRLVRAIQSIALTLNRHYSARLHRLYLVDAPAIVHLPVRAIKALLHPSTSSKIIICDLEDSRLPVDLDYDSVARHRQSSQTAPDDS